MTIQINENTTLALTNQKYAAGLFDAIDNYREHLSQFLPWVGNMQTVENVRAYLQYCEGLIAAKTECSFIIVQQDKVIGRIGFHHIDVNNKSAAIGYWLAKDAEGKGIITNACSKIIEYGFNDLGLNRIEIKAATHNPKSQAIPQKLHFTQEGILRQAEFVNGSYFDIVVYGLVKEDWIKLNA